MFAPGVAYSSLFWMYWFVVIFTYLFLRKIDSELIAFSVLIRIRKSANKVKKVVRRGPSAKIYFKRPLCIYFGAVNSGVGDLRPFRLPPPWTLDNIRVYFLPESQKVIIGYIKVPYSHISKLQKSCYLWTIMFVSALNYWLLKVWEVSSSRLG